MKHIVLILLTVTLSLSLTAQSLKHSFLISTSLSFKKDEAQTVNITSVNDYTQTLNIKPKVGYFVLSRLAVGIYAPYQSQFHKYDGTVLSRYKKVGVGPVARYYQPIYKRKLYGLLDCGFSWNWETSFKENSGTSKDRFTSTILGVGLGYFLNKNIAIEAIVDSTEDLRDDSGNGPYLYTSQLNLNFGFVIYLGTNL